MKTFKEFLKPSTDSKEKQKEIALSGVDTTAAISINLDNLKQKIERDFEEMAKKEQ